MTQMELELMERIAKALEELANPKPILEMAPPGWVSAADELVKRRELLERALAADERSAAALEAIADRLKDLQLQPPEWLGGLSSLAWECGQAFERGRGAS